MPDNEEFFENLYDLTHDKVLAYIIAKCGKTEDIADIFQEAYMEIVSIINKRGTAYIKKPEHFVMQIAKRKVYHHYKFLERLRGLEIQSDFEEEIETVEEYPFEENLINHLTVEEVFDYLSKKDLLTRKIFYLYYYMDKTIGEIATLLSISESNVKNRLYRTLKEIKEYFRKEMGG